MEGMQAWPQLPRWLAVQLPTLCVHSADPPAQKAPEDERVLPGCQVVQHARLCLGRGQGTAARKDEHSQSYQPCWHGRFMSSHFCCE